MTGHPLSDTDDPRRISEAAGKAAGRSSLTIGVATATISRHHAGPSLSAEVPGDPFRSDLHGIVGFGRSPDPRCETVADMDRSIPDTAYGAACRSRDPDAVR